ncbi:MAG: glycosyltransferase [Saccharofermentanales bacterium]
MNKLIMFTDNYPYRSGGSFVDCEIKYLSKSFSEIILVNTFYKSNKIYYEVPTNVTLLPLNCSSRINEKFKIFKGMFFLLFKTNEEWELTKTIIKPNFIKHLFFYYIKAMAIYRYTQCIDVFNNYNISNDDRIILYTYWFHHMNYVAIKLKQNYFKNAKIISRAHGADLYEERYPFGFSPLKKYCIINTDRILTCSMNGETYLKKLFPEYSKKISYSYLGTNDYGMNLSTTTNDFILVSCSSLSPIKRIDLIITALSKLKEKKINLKWIHFGDGVLNKKMVKMANECLSGNISFVFKGQVTNIELMNFYKMNHVDLFINLSSSEGIPVSIMEAMSFNIPVMATNVGGIGELVDDENGFLVDKTIFPEAIAKIIQNYYKYTDLEITKKRLKSREKWEKNFLAKDNYTKFINDNLL